MSDDRLRLCALGDLESVHTRRWLEPFVERGHEVHAVSYYRPAATVDGVRLHALEDQSSPSQRGATAAPGRRTSLSAALPPTLLRLLNALRYQRRGLGRTIRDIRPDVLHAHYVVEYGFFAARTGFHPLVVSAWGSDVLVAAQSSPLARALARYTLRRADLVTSNNEYMTGRLRQLGVPPERLATIVFGTDSFFLDHPDAGVNVQPREGHPPTIISTRSLDSPLYNVETVLRALALLRERLPEARLLIAGEGRLRPRLEELSRELGLGDSVRFLGFLDREALRDAFAAAEVYVSIPGSDATSVATLSAMAVGCFPVVSDLPSQREWIEDGGNGFLVPLGDAGALARRLGDALGNAALRVDAAVRNRRLVEDRGVWQRNALLMEEWYGRLAREFSRKAV